MAGIVGPDGERYIWVMDPMTRKLKVPLSVIEPTQATATAGTVPSLCMLFLDGRCKHPACRQVHISLPVLQKLRRDAQHAPTCCAHHGDQRDNSILVSNFSHVSIVANPLSNSPIPTPAGGNSPTPSAAAPPPPPPSYPAGGAATTTDSPELNGIMYPPLPSAANEKVSAPSGGSSTGASSYAAALLGGGATTSPQASAQASPPSYQQSAIRGGRSPTPPPPQGSVSTVLFTIPSSKIAMTVGLQRYLAQSGYLGRSSTGTPVQSGTPTSPPGPAPYNSSKKEGNGPPTNLPPPAGGGVDGTHSSGDNKENATLNIPLKMICRLHLSHKCRYLEDCNNVHICREMESKLPAVSSAHPALGPQHCSDVLQSLRPKVSTATVGNTVYSVSVVSSGSISDTDMHQIVQNYKLSNPHVQLRIVDVRAGAAATTAASGSAHNTSKDSNDDHFLVSSSNEPSTLLPPASSISPSAFSSSGRGGVLFGSFAAPISPPGPHQSSLQGDHSAAVTSQFAGPGTSPLLQDQGMPHSIISGLGGGLGLPPPMDALPAHLAPPPQTSASPSSTTNKPLPSSTSATGSSLPSYSAGTTTSGGLTTYPPPPNRSRGVGTAGAGSRSQQRGNHHHLLSGETQVPGGGFVDESTGNGSGGGANVGIPTWAYGNTS